MIAKVYRGAVLVALAAGLACGCTDSPAGGAARVSKSRRLMGAPWTITVYAADEQAGAEAIGVAFTEIERLEAVLSDYDPASELSRLSAAAPTAEPVAVGADVWRVLVAAEAFREHSGGAFDIAVGPLTSLWRQARRSGRLPRPDKLAAARAAVGAGTVELIPATRSVRLAKPGTRLDPGGIGIGYAADRALEILASRGIDSAMIDASGDILVSGPPPGSTGWRITVAPLWPGAAPETLVLSHAAVTTSGDAYQGVEIDGVRYSHIVDPRTGIGVIGPAVATIIAPDATTADALATAASVLGHDAGEALVARFDGCSGRFAWRQGEASGVATTPGWPGASRPEATNCPGTHRP